VSPGQDLDQGGLPGAVLTEQAVHLTRTDDEVDTVQGADPREGLDDPAHPQQRLHLRTARCHLGSSPTSEQALIGVSFDQGRGWICSLGSPSGGLAAATG